MSKHDAQQSHGCLMVVKGHDKRERHAEGTSLKRLREWEGVYVGERVNWFCSHHYVGSVVTQTRGGLQVLTPGRNAGSGAGVW